MEKGLGTSLLHQVVLISSIKPILIKSKPSDLVTIQFCMWSTKEYLFSLVGYVILNDDGSQKGFRYS